MTPRMGGARKCRTVSVLIEGKRRSSTTSLKTSSEIGSQDDSDLIFNMNAPAKSIVNSETFKSACPPKASIVHRYVNANLI